MEEIAPHTGRDGFNGQLEFHVLRIEDKTEVGKVKVSAIETTVPASLLPTHTSS